jgi:hypothetical protein
MATRLPLVLNKTTGRIEELPVADSLPGGVGGGTSNTFIQQTDPMVATPYIWFRTDASGKVVDILKG